MKTKDFHITDLIRQLNDLGYETEIDYKDNALYLYRTLDNGQKWYHLGLSKEQELGVDFNIIERKLIELVFTLYDLLFKELEK